MTVSTRCQPQPCGLAALVICGCLLAHPAFAADGDRDLSFDENGVAVWTLDTGTGFVDTVMAVDAQNRVLLAGTADGPRLEDDSVVVRFRSDGSRDTSFGDNGEVLFTYGDFSNVVDVILQTDGKILVLGTVTSGPLTNSDREIFVARLLTDGSLDPAFGEGGTVMLESGSGSSDSAQGIAVDSQGRIVVAGSRLKSRKFDMTTFRLLPDGSVDESFGADGSGLRTFRPTDLFAGFPPTGVRIDDQDRPVLSIKVRRNEGTDTPACVVRLTIDGALDTSFDEDGWVSVDLPGSDAFVNTAFVIDSAGRYVLFGWATRDIAMLRLLPDGTLDTTFGDAGFVRQGYQPFTRVSNQVSESTSPAAIALQDDGKFVLCGSVRLSESGFAQQGGWIARYDPVAGAFDPTFGSDGFQLIGAIVERNDIGRDEISTPGDTQVLQEAFDLALLGNGRAALVAGSGYFNDQYRGAVARVIIQDDIAAEAIIDLTRADQGIADGDTDLIADSVSGVAIDLAYTIANSGTAELVIDDIAFDAISGCSIELVGTAPSSIAASQLATLQLQVTPSVVGPDGAWQATVLISNNDADRSPFAFTIAGTATVTDPYRVITMSCSRDDTHAAIDAGPAELLPHTFSATLVDGHRFTFASTPTGEG